MGIEMKTLLITALIRLTSCQYFFLMIEMKTLLITALILLSTAAQAEQPHYSWDEPQQTRSDPHNYALDDLERSNEQALIRQQSQRDYNQRQRIANEQQQQMQQLINELRR